MQKKKILEDEISGKDRNPFLELQLKKVTTELNECQEEIKSKVS